MTAAPAPDQILVILCVAAWVTTGALALRLRSAGLPLCIAALLTGAWAISAMQAGAASPVAGLPAALESGRLLACVLVLQGLWARIGRSLGARRRPPPFGAALVVVSCAALLAALMPAPAALDLANPAVLARLAIDVLGLLLAENVYFNAPLDSRWHVALPCAAIGGLLAYDLILVADAVLFRVASPALLRGQYAAAALVCPLLVAGIRRNAGDWGAALREPRDPVMHSASLLVTGTFLVGLAAESETSRYLGADWGRVAEVSLAFGGAVGLTLLLTSAALRGQVGKLLISPFRRRRYDYRREWLRCMEVLSAPDGYVSLSTRAIRAVADVVDSPAGLLLLREGEGRRFVAAGGWNMRVPRDVFSLDDAPLRATRGGEWVAVSEATSGPWITSLPSLWLAVPLRHRGRLIGAVLLDRPRAAFALDREVFDLLRVVAQEIGAFLAERSATEALLEARQMQAFGERFAFVAHDVKNVASQLNMLLANAEQHIADPAFQRDLLATVGGCATRIGALLARLREPDGAASARPSCDVAARAAAQAARHGARVVFRVAGTPPLAAIAADVFDSVVAHLVDNALEASRTAVEIDVSEEDANVVVDVSDRGVGMSEAFVRERLFRPFVSSKTAGFGIGAYQARELVRAAGGEIHVASRLGEGTSMRIVLPAIGPDAATPRRLPALEIG